MRPSLNVLGALQPRPPTRCACRTGFRCWSDPADTPAASYALGTQPGGRPLFIMGTTHVISNCLDAPDLRAGPATRRRAARPMADQRRHQRRRRPGSRREMLGYGLGDVAVAASDRHGIPAPEPGQMTGAPVFIPHTRAERGPLWFAEPRTALLGLPSPTPRRRRPPGAWSKVCCSPTG